MTEDNDLEKRAIEELLRETDRARLRAETMGPAGWLKCPLRSTNKRFLLNTLRSTGLQRGSSESESRDSATRGRLRSESPNRRRDRSRSPHRNHGRNRGRTDKHYQEDNRSKKQKKQEREEERHDRHIRERKHERGNEGHKRDRHK